jgi:polar amino acid transport system substrate-binding protein
MSIRRWVAVGVLASLGLVSQAWGQSVTKVRIGAEDDFRPYAYFEFGRPAGLAVELVQAAWAAAGVPVELVSLPYARCVRQVETGQIAGCFNTLRDAATETKFLWHQQALFKGKIGIYSRADAGSAPVALAELRGKRIGVTNGYDYGAAFDKDPAMVRDSAASDLISLRKLAAGRVDYALVYDRVANDLMAKNAGLASQVRARGILTETDLYISFSKRYPDAQALVDKFDIGLDKIRKNGEYARIEARWK